MMERRNRLKHVEHLWKYINQETLHLVGCNSEISNCLNKLLLLLLLLLLLFTTIEFSLGGSKTYTSNK